MNRRTLVKILAALPFVPKVLAQGRDSVLIHRGNTEPVVSLHTPYDLYGPPIKEYMQPSKEYLKLRRGAACLCPGDSLMIDNKTFTVLDIRYSSWPDSSWQYVRVDPPFHQRILP